MRPFECKKLYQGLGSGILSWGKRFVRQITFAERESCFQWSDYFKVDVFGHHLTNVAERHNSLQVGKWWYEQPILEHAMQSLSTRRDENHSSP